MKFGSCCNQLAFMELMTYTDAVVDTGGTNSATTRWYAQTYRMYGCALLGKSNEKYKGSVSH